MSMAEIEAPPITDMRADWIKKYLLDRGWKQQPYKGEHLWVFEAPIKDDNGDTILQTLPRSAQSPDFVMRARELVRILSVIEDRPVEDVLRDIRHETAPETRTPANARPEAWNVSPRLLRLATIGLFILVLASLASNIVLWIRVEADHRRTDEIIREIRREHEPPRP
jgi:hypothetical protein